MKKSLLLCLSLCLYFGMSAQITDRGNFILGTTIGFSTSTSTVNFQGEGISVESNGYRNLQFNVTPSIGYFLANNWALGIGMDYTLNRTKKPKDVTNPDTELTTSYDSDLLFGPFTRFYFPFGEDKAFFLESTFGFGSSSNEIEIANETQTASNNVIAFGFGPGFTIFSNDAVGVETIAKYNWSKSNSTINIQGISTKTSSSTNAIDFSVGFQVYFARLAPVGQTRTRPNTTPDAPRPGFY